jgi:hypothetical protein
MGCDVYQGENNTCTVEWFCYQTRDLSVRVSNLCVATSKNTFANAQTPTSLTNCTFPATFQKCHMIGFERRSPNTTVVVTDDWEIYIPFPELSGAFNSAAYSLSPYTVLTTVSSTSPAVVQTGSVVQMSAVVQTLSTATSVIVPQQSGASSPQVTATRVTAVTIQTSLTSVVQKRQLLDTSLSTTLATSTSTVSSSPPFISTMSATAMMEST